MELVERHPHKVIIDFLDNAATIEGMSPLVARDMDLEGITRESADAAIEELIEANIVVQRLDMYAGDMIGLRKAVEAHEAIYDELKDRVYEKAKQQGLWPKWRQGQGWRLVNGGGETVTVGPMWALEEYLDEHAKV
jgi:hypothetical protein